MTTLSAQFERLARERFGFLVEEFSLAPPARSSQGWQFTELLYRGQQIAIRATFDNEEQVLIYVHLLVDGTMPPRDDPSLTFLIDAAVRGEMRGVARRGFISTGDDLDRTLADYAMATRIEMPRLLRQAQDLQLASRSPLPSS